MVGSDTGEKGRLMLELPSGFCCSIFISIWLNWLSPDTIVPSLHFDLLVDEAVLPDLFIEHGLVLAGLFLLDQSLSVISREDHEYYSSQFIILFDFVFDVL